MKLTAQKARKMLKEGKANKKRLTAKQRRYFWLVTKGDKK